MLGRLLLVRISPLHTPSSDVFIQVQLPLEELCLGTGHLERCLSCRPTLSPDN